MGRQNFDSGIVKIDASGRRVFSDYIDEEAGESLAVSDSDTSAVPESGTPVVSDSDTSAVSTERPADDDTKNVWFDYAVQRGFEGEKESLTKAEFIEQYG